MVNVGGIVSVGGGPSSGGSGGSGSGVIGVNGITVHQIGGNYVVDGAGLSGLISPNGAGSVATVSQYTESFSDTVSGYFQHNFNAGFVQVQIFDNTPQANAIAPDKIILENRDAISVIFNEPQAGTVVIHGPSGVIDYAKYSESFTGVVSLTVTHGLNSEDVIVQVRNADSPAAVIIPDKITINDANTVGLVFNEPESGRVTIIR